MDQACVFCKIIAGDLPSHTLYENDQVLAFLDIHPVNAGHAIVIPKNHSRNIFDIQEDDWLAVTSAVRKLAIAIEDALQADGVNIAMNNREHAGQTVFHPHVHIIPRFKGDGVKLMPQRSYGAGEAEETLEKIRAVLR